MNHARPRPADFRARYVALGWTGCIAHYGTSYGVMRRWVNEEGADQLAAERGQHVERLRARDRAFRQRAAAQLSASSLAAAV